MLWLVEGTRPLPGLRDTDLVESGPETTSARAGTVMTSRVDGFLPIEAYAAIGDGRTVAMVGSDGRIDWWPIPTLDAPPICAALLDADQGGYISMAPSDSFTVERRYVEATNVLQTTFTTTTGSVRVTDALNVGIAGRLPWTELARRVEGLDGYVNMSWKFVPGNRFGNAMPWVHQASGRTLVEVGDQHLAVLGFDVGVAEVTAHDVGAAFAIDKGQAVLLAVIASNDEPLFIPDRRAIESRMDHSVESWRLWSNQVHYESPWHYAIIRSALALKLLLCSDHGAIAAAATTSLPERIGGSKNWDYRYAWVRDSSFTLTAFLHLGLHEEVHASVSWLLGAIHRSAPSLEVCYTLSGGVVDDEAELDLPGYRRSRPVRAGNTAVVQLQLGSYGDLFATIASYVSDGHILDARTCALLENLADRCCNQWRSKDSGIWELQEVQHYTISKMGCWVALDKAVELAEQGQMPAWHIERWRAERDEIVAFVNRYCWSSSKNAYSFFAGTDRLDAAVLLAGRAGFDRGSRLESTIAALQAELSVGHFMYRYSGMAEQEGAFIACSFWLVDALSRVGRRTEAVELMNELVSLGNDVGLMSEQIDPSSGAFLGNFPQGLSHLALINAVDALNESMP